MIAGLVALAFQMPGQGVPSPVPQPLASVTATVAPPADGGDTGGFTLNPWTNFKRDVRREAQQSLDIAAEEIRNGTSTPDLGTTPYLRDLWAWGRAVLNGAGILALAVLASAAAGLWPGLNRYAAGAVLPRLVLAV